MHRRTFLVTAGTAATAGVAGCLEGAAVSDDRVEMTQVDFRPERLTVEAGTTVEFANTSSHGHTVTAFQGSYPEGAEYFATGGFDSEEQAREGWDNQDGVLYQGESWEHTFEIPGTYQYYCIPHLEADMIGWIEVEEPDDASGNDTADGE